MSFLFRIEYLGGGLLFIILSIPLILKKVPPNPIYGFRTKKTLSDKQIWYKANYYCGLQLFYVGLIYMGFILIEWALKVKNAALYNALLLGLLAVVVLVRSLLYLRKL